MAGCGRRFAVRAGVAGFAAALGLASSAVVSQAANPVQMSLQVGYHGSYKLGQWMPVTVDITNHGADIEGNLEIQGSNSFAAKGGPPGGTAVYQVPLSLAAGASKHFQAYVSEDFPGTIDARVVQGGRIVASQQASVSTTISGLLVGVLSDESSALDVAATIHPGGVAPTVVHLATSDLSDSALVLRAFDVLAIDDFSTDTLTDGQRNALVDYVMQGGTLLLGTGGSWHKTLAGLPSAVVPMQVSGSAVLGTSNGLGGLTGVEVATGTVAAAATTWLADGNRPLLIEQQGGAGLVAMATFDWAQGPVATWSGTPALLRQVVVRSTYGNINNPYATSSLTLNKGGVTNSVASRGGSLSQALGNVPALDLPAWWLIGGLVLVYVLLVGPANYFILRAMGRRALAWVTVPVIALVASGGAYGASVITKGTSVLANEIAIVHVQQGWEHAYNEQYTGIVAPTRGDYDVALGNRPSTISPIYYYSSNFGDPNAGAMRINTATDGITLPAMSAFTMRGFATEGITAAPTVTGQAQLAGGQLKGTIKNMSTVDFTDGVVIAGNTYQKLGELAPNATTTFNLQPAMSSTFTGQPVFMQVYPNALTCCGQPNNSSSDAERQAEIRTAVLSTLPLNNFGNLPVAGNPTVVLWTKQPFQQITVNGGHPRTYIEGAIVLTMPIGEIGVGSLASGVVSGRIVDLDANLNQGGPPGLVIADSGSMTIAFNPALAPGTHLTGVTISSANPYGGKVIPAGGSTSSVKGQVWDWSASAWVDVNYQDNGTTTVPAAGINPTTGEIRLKISSTGQFAAGFLSISGDVT
jgi:hypothetical protein